MSEIVLKLKQASAVLGVTPKELQNLVQFGIVKPRLRRQVFWFDKEGLLRAKVALYLKESLGASTQTLARFTEALFEEPSRCGRSSVTLLSRPRAGDQPVEIRVPLGSLAQEIDQRLPLANLSPDLPRGRKRLGWAGELLDKVLMASGDLKNSSDAEIIHAVRTERSRGKAVPEVSILGEATKKTVSRRR
ncbi:MAG: hypothetical protein HY235_00965 [Acidobacteria bacterium]|nr:hypothetical protein [Acidobacteriota bacterium]